jgi:hypothetical protein
MKDSMKEYRFNCTNIEVKRKSTNIAIDFFLGKDWLHLGEDVLRILEYSRVAYQDSKQRNRVTEGSTTMRCFLIVNVASMNMYEKNPLDEV